MLRAPDHKTIAKLHLWTALAFFLVGGALALLIRWQLAWPGTPVPVAGQVIPDLQEQGGIIPPEVYAAFFSQHGTIMIFYVIIPLLTGAFGNFLVPLQVGARNLALPGCAAAGYAVHLIGGLVLLGSHLAPGGAAAAGWTAYAPLSVAADAGQNLWIASLLLSGTGAVLTAISQIVTIVNRRAPGMGWMRMPIATWSFLATAGLTLLSTPALVVALTLLLFDRIAGTSFYVPAGTVMTGVPLNEAASGASPGQPLLWQHLFWFYAHPAVYIMILPAMGMMCEVFPAFARKPLFGYGGFVASITAIAGLGFLVWGHHMFVSGMNPTLAMAFSAATFLIAVPSAVEVFNWLATLWGGAIRFPSPMLHALAFLLTFVVGGLSGVFQASTPVNLHLHDTYFVVAHIHYVVFGGSVFAFFAALTFYFPKLFGCLLDETLGRLHFGLTFAAFNFTFFPMHLLGLGGMPRRVYDPTAFETLRHLQPLNVAISLGAFTLAVVQLLFVTNLVLSLLRARGPAARALSALAGAAATGSVGALAGILGGAHPSGWIFPACGAAGAVAGGWIGWRSGAAGERGRGRRFGTDPGDNPWCANSLEWQTSSPPPAGNFPAPVQVYRGPYEYSVPDEPKDWLPQNAENVAGREKVCHGRA